MLTTLLDALAKDHSVLPMLADFLLQTGDPMAEAVRGLVVERPECCYCGYSDPAWPCPNPRCQVCGEEPLYGASSITAAASVLLLFGRSHPFHKAEAPDMPAKVRDVYAHEFRYRPEMRVGQAIGLSQLGQAIVSGQPEEVVGVVRAVTDSTIELEHWGYRFSVPRVPVRPTEFVYTPYRSGPMRMAHAHMNGYYPGEWTGDMLRDAETYRMVMVELDRHYRLHREARWEWSAGCCEECHVVFWTRRRINGIERSVERPVLPGHRQGQLLKPTEGEEGQPTAQPGEDGDLPL